MVKNLEIRFYSPDGELLYGRSFAPDQAIVLRFNESGYPMVGNAVIKPPFQLEIIPRDTASVDIPPAKPDK